MKQYDYKTISRTMLGDLHTPVSTYLKVRDIFPQSALMESSDYHGSENNRSFIALCPLASVSIDHGTAIFRLPDDSREEHPITDAYRVENALNDFRARFRVEGEYSNYCGLYGYTSFNAVRYFENIPVKDSREATNDAPDMLYILYKYLIVFNDFKNEMLLLEMLAPGETSELDQVQKAIHNRNYTAYDFRAIGPTTSPLTDEEHKANIRRGIAHCLRGDVFQIVLSRRFEQRFTGDDFKLYRALRSINPSPYLFYFDFGGFRIFGSSPETHCRIEGRHAYIDPIAGTTKRTGDAEQDALNARYLHDDPKENAEHVMLVDLARNDLSRNCHDVKVDFYKVLQPCHPPRQPCQRNAPRRGRPRQGLHRHLPCRYPERRPESTRHAAHQPAGTAQPWSLRRLHRFHRTERLAEPGDYDSYFCQPQWCPLVPGRRRHRSQEQRRVRTARGEQQARRTEKGD